MKKYTWFAFLLFSINSLWAQEKKDIDLSGYWKLFVDVDQKYATEQMKSVAYTDTIVLPATLDEAKKGPAITPNATTRLSRNYAFAGRAWYQKEITIPASWGNETKILHLERTKVTHVWVDNQYAGSSLLIASSQQYDLTPFLSPGKHLLTILVDNGDTCGLPDVIRSSHQWSDDTQTNWNGILGEMSIQVKPTIYFKNIRAYTDTDNKTVTLKATIHNQSDKNVTANIYIHSYLFNSSATHTPAPQTTEVAVEPGEHTYTVHYALGAEAQLWSEYTPNLYQLNLKLTTPDAPPHSYRMQVGLRTVATQGRQFTINGSRMFLRGKHDGCVFPLTGYAPTQLSDWLRYFDILRSYGFNHVRFHSWCPPAAAFEAADLKGFYLQPELPIWGGIAEKADDPVNAFLLREGKAVMDNFGNHPSFICFSTGNELWESIEGMKALTNQLRDYDNRHLYALGSNFHLGWAGEQGTEDFIVACRIGGLNDAAFEPHVRSSFSFADAIDGGILNAEYPNTLRNFDRGVSRATKPVIGHETGQFQIYPQPQEIKKYTGVLYPYNLKRFIEQTNRKHGTDKTERFFKASGALSLLCYKADTEMSLRTSELAGYQVLDIQDFPGQGTALVGMLDAFMDSKGLVTPEEFASFNTQVVPLWVSPSYTWYNDKLLSGQIKLFNYPRQALTQATIDWCLQECATGKTMQKGTVNGKELTRGLSTVAALEIDLSGYRQPIALQLELQVRGTAYQNKYHVWVYPRENKYKKASDVKLFNTVNAELFRHLRAGKKALLMPSADAFPLQTVGGLFTNDYWNYSMFKSISENANKPVSPGTLGYLIDEAHPLFRHFPTSYHSDWQWWAPARNARPLIMDHLSKETGMIVEAIDNVERNHKLGVLFECRVGKGKLFVCMSDLNKGKEYKECAQLLAAIYQYIGSKEFNPLHEWQENEIEQLFTNATNTPRIEGVKNVSY